MSELSGVTVVCGGGGVWGLAWMTGVALGLADAGLDIRSAGRFVGTSAGSAVSAQLLSGTPLLKLYERQVDPAKQTRELTPKPDAFAGLLKVTRQEWHDDEARLKALCELGLTASTVSVAARRKSIEDRLRPSRDAWPDKPLTITAVDAESARLHAFDARSGVSLIDAVAASCAVPGVWPAVAIGGRRFVDGGIWRTAENAHLAEGAEAVLVLSPMAGVADARGASNPWLVQDIDHLESSGARVLVLSADENSRRTMGTDPLDPTSRDRAALAGREQGLREATGVREIFGPGPRTWGEREARKWTE